MGGCVISRLESRTENRTGPYGTVGSGLLPLLTPELYYSTVPHES